MSDEVRTLEYTDEQYQNAGAAVGWLCSWACQKFGLTATPENMAQVFRASSYLAARSDALRGFVDEVELYSQDVNWPALVEHMDV